MGAWGTKWNGDMRDGQTLGESIYNYSLDKLWQNDIVDDTCRNKSFPNLRSRISELLWLRLLRLSQYFARTLILLWNRWSFSIEKRTKHTPPCPHCICPSPSCSHRICPVSHAPYCIIIYDDHIWWSCMMVMYDMIVGDHHIWWSYMMILYDHHIWWSHLMIFP